MLPPDFFLFLQIIIFLFITPGTPRIVIISYSINYGMKKCIWSATGDVIANFIQATLVIFVIGSFFLDHPKVLNIFKSNFSFLKDGFLVAGTSPKAWMFFPFIFPQFIDFNSNNIIQFIILIFTYMILDFLSLIGYALLANKLVAWIKTNPRVINTISACVLIIIAIIIAITQKY